MPPFLNVAGGRAGPSAIGILVPPGARTVIVLRPRSLAVDLLVVQRENGTTGFLETNRQTAGLEAQKLARSLVNAAEAGAGRIFTAPAQDSPGWMIQAEVESFELLTCPRQPGQAYRPLILKTEAEAQQMADTLRAVICPAPDAEQELYTNMSQFGSQPAATRPFRNGP